jgi:hypothetical protein
LLALGAEVHLAATVAVAVDLKVNSRRLPTHLISLALVAPRVQVVRQVKIPFRPIQYWELLVRPFRVVMEL